MSFETSLIYSASIFSQKILQNLYFVFREGMVHCAPVSHGEKRGKFLKPCKHCSQGYFSFPLIFKDSPTVPRNGQNTKKIA